MPWVLLLVLEVTKLFSRYITLWGLSLKGKEDYSTLFFQKKDKDKSNIEDAWNQVGSLMVLTPQIHTYYLGSLRGAV